jgi:hypothetical protein
MIQIHLRFAREIILRELITQVDDLNEGLGVVHILSGEIPVIVEIRETKGHHQTLDDGRIGIDFK